MQQPEEEEAVGEAAVAPQRSVWTLVKRAVRWFLGFLFGPSPRDEATQPPRWLVFALLAVIVAIASYVRLVRLADLPAGFYCDEAGNGYNAYSLLQTGKDETGTKFPLYVWSFGISYKNPIFIYSAIVPIALGGLSEFTVRVTSAAYGIGTVIAIFFLGRALLGAWAGLVAAAILALLPWHLHFSRIAFELITYPLFVVAGTTLLVRWAQGRRTLVTAMVLFGLSLYTYVPAKLFVPLYVAGFAILYLGNLLRRWRETLLAFALLLVTVAPLVFFDLSNRERSTQYFKQNFIGTALSPEQTVRRFLYHYQMFFSRHFLFYNGDMMVRHAVRNHGELYLFMVPLLPLGIAVCVGRRDRALLLPCWWLALYPAAASLMTEVPSASRGIIGAPAFALLAAIGAAGVLRLPAQLLDRKGALAVQLAMLAAGAQFALPQVNHYWNLYNNVYPRISARTYSGFQFGHRDVVQYFLEHGHEYDLMLLTPHLGNRPEIFLLFYSAFSPARYHQEGMEALRRDKKMRVAWPNDLYLYRDSKRTLYAVTPSELHTFADYEIKKRITAPDGVDAFVLVDLRKPKAFINRWQIVGPFPIEGAPPPPRPENLPPLQSQYEGQPWRAFAADQASVTLNDYFRPDADQACAWATGWVYTEQEREIGVFAGFEHFGQVWINGVEVPLTARGNRNETAIDTSVGFARLNAGHNFVAVKTCAQFGGWSFYFRFANRDGKDVEDLRWTAVG